MAYNGEVMRLNLFLVGRTGQGKSATGNTILNNPRFRTSCNAAPRTNDVGSFVENVSNYQVQVVDGPGLEDRGVVTNMTTGMAICFDGVDAFLLVIRFGNRVVEEDEKSIATLKQIFGDGVFRHLIVVMTCGDMFHVSMTADGTPGRDFHEWCQKQRGVFRELYTDCQGRFVLFNNLEEDDEKKLEQRREVIQRAHELRRSGRYTRDSFNNCAPGREKLILKLSAPQLKNEFKEKISRLNEEIKDVSSQPSDGAMEKLKGRVLELKREIEQHDQGHGVLQGLLEAVAQVEENIKNVEKIRAANKELENRTVMLGGGVLGLICVIAYQTLRN